MNNTPTDAEVVAVMRDGYNCRYNDEQDHIDFARAVLAKWGTPPAAVREPAAYLHDDGYWTATKTDAGRKLNDRLLLAGSPKVAVYTTPQPAKALPLTDEQIRAMCRASWVFETVKRWVRITEQHHGIKGSESTVQLV